MKLLVIFILFAGTLKAQDSSLNKAGHALGLSKTFQIGAVVATGFSYYQYSKGFKYSAYGCLAFAAACEAISITYYYRGCQYMIKANGIRIVF